MQLRRPIDNYTLLYTTIRLIYNYCRPMHNFTDAYKTLQTKIRPTELNRKCEALSNLNIQNILNEEFK